jgi:hypothetical protein
LRRRQPGGYGWGHVQLKLQAAFMAKKPTRKTSPPSPGQPYLPGKSQTARKPDGKFEKGIRPNPGRAKGVRNRTTKLLKEAILEAATLIGQDGRGKGGLTGYLMMLATKERAVYARLLEKVLPMQVHIEDRTVKVYSTEEAAQKLRERGLPVPPTLLQIASGIGTTFAEDYEAEADEIGCDEPEASGGREIN